MFADSFSRARIIQGNRAGGQKAVCFQSKMFVMGKHFIVLSFGTAPFSRGISLKSLSSKFRFLFCFVLFLILLLFRGFISSNVELSMIIISSSYVIASAYVTKPKIELGKLSLFWSSLWIFMRATQAIDLTIRTFLRFRHEWRGIPCFRQG